LTLGLPTTATAAIILAAFQQWGLQPGPLLFQTQPDLIWGLIELYQADYHPRWLFLARDFQDEQNWLFWDSEGAGYYFYGEDAEQLLARPKEVPDGAMPSGNSVSARLRSARCLSCSIWTRSRSSCRFWASRMSGAAYDACSDSTRVSAMKPSAAESNRQAFGRSVFHSSPHALASPAISVGCPAARRA